MGPLERGKGGPRCQRDLSFVHLEVRGTVYMDDLRLTEFDQILVCGPRVKAADIQVGFAQLLPPTAAAAVADGVAVVVGAWWSHLMVGGGHIRLKKREGMVRTGQSHIQQ